MKWNQLHIVLSVFFLVSCGGGGEGDSFFEEVANTVIPDITPQTIEPETSVTPEIESGINNCIVNAGDPLVSITGKATFDRVPLNTSGALDFNNITQHPIKEVVVEAICNDVVIASSLTDAHGDYTLSVPGNASNVFVRVKTQLFKTGQPSWDVAIIDESQSLELIFAMDSNPFDSGVNDSVLNLHASSGWNGSTYASTRVAAPFAILDTIYDAMQLVLAEDSNIVFPPLEVLWSSTNLSGSFYINNQISVLGGLSDTDEFDEHVIAHEWGHYFQDAFSRDDSIGGPHSSGDILDIRVAFSEGFGNAFSSMVTGDEIYKDSQSVFLSNGFTINVESNTCPNEGWYSECSVQSVLYDFFDAANDDVLNLGFSPIYSVLKNSISDTDAMTSIFSFINPFKDLTIVNASDVDTLLSSQSIDSITDDVGTGMTSNPGVTNQIPAFYNSAFPISNVCVTGENGGYNGLGVRRFIHFTATTSFTSFTASRTSGLTSADPDMYLYSKGEIVAAGETFTANSESLSANLIIGDTYVLELLEFSYSFVNYDSSAFGAINETCFTVSRN